MQLLTRPCHTPEFLNSTHLGVEAHITRYDRLPDWPQYIPFVGGVHLPYAGMNLAAFDDVLRRQSIAKVKEAIVEGCQYSIDRMVMHPTGIHTMDDEVVGDYDRLISAIQEIADFAAIRKITICLENMVMHRPAHLSFGCTAAEWFRIREDAGRPNLMLTLDSSHAATSVALFATAEERFARLYDFLAHPELIGRVHWSDARLTNQEALYHDMHLVPGEGDLPLDFHRQINRLDVVKTLEQRRPEEDMLAGLKFIASL